MFIKILPSYFAFAIQTSIFMSCDKRVDHFLSIFDF
jgi:hypothetical protein